MKAISFELYKIFYHVAQSLSFSKAGEKLFLSQSAVSQAIKSLEEKLSVKLFTRTTKQVRLTPEGEALYTYVAQAYQALEQGEDYLSRLKKLDCGEIHIAASDTICRFFLLPYLKRFHEAYPAIHLKITNRPSPVCLKLAQEGQVDLAVLHLTLSDELPPGSWPLCQVEPVFIGGPPYCHLAQSKTPLAELTKQPLLLLEKNTVTRRGFDELLSQYGLVVEPEIELGSLDLCIELTRIGLGLSFVIGDFLKPYLEQPDLYVLPCREPLPSGQLVALPSLGRPLSKAGEKFVTGLT